MKTTFTIPNGYTYIGCGIKSFTCSINMGGMYGTPTITYSNGIITLSANISGNWGETTVTGSVTIAVFVM